MNYRRICVWTGPLGQTEGLMRTLTSLPGATGLRDPFSKEFVRLTGADEAAPSANRPVTTYSELLVMRSPAAHAVGIDLRRFSQDLHIFFIQHPDERLPALSQAVTDPEWQERAYTWQEKLFLRLEGMGARCLVLDAQQWRSMPLQVLRTVATHLGVNPQDFQPVLPQAEYVWRGDAWLSFGPEADLREACLSAYRKLGLHAIQDFVLADADAPRSLALPA